MTYIIAEPCVGVKDASCVAVCPVDCIYEGADMYYIHPDECIDCGVCEPECPVGAIVPDTKGQDVSSLIELNRKFAQAWPNITRRKDAPADADKFKDEKGKLEKYFSEKPGSGD